MESVLSTTERDRVVHTTSKLQRLDGVVHVWVRDARPLRHGVESTIPAVPLKLSASMQVAELREMVQTEFTQLSSYRRETDGPLRLMFDGRVLDDTEPVAAYLKIRSATKQGRWPSPFAGIIWVIPWRR